MKRQIILIHGGDVFENYDQYLSFLKNQKRVDFERYQSRKKDWKETLNEKLCDDYEVISPQMPNKQNAKYLEWKIWFDKFIPYFEPKVILIGHSLGGTFLAKYLAENDFPKKIRATFFVAPVFDEINIKESLADFKLPETLEKLEKQGGKIFLYHSKDDPVVPFADFEKFKKALKNATGRIFTDRGHFGQEEFPEIIKDIKIFQ
jgi:uncharacterized protein